MRKWSKIFTYGDVFARDILKGEVSITEKVDGSQFNFGIQDASTMAFEFASKGAEIDVAKPPNIFAPSVDYILRNALCHPGWTYHGEAMHRPKHNTLAYGRVPSGHVALFGVVDDQGEYQDYDVIAAEAERLGLEVVPEIWRGPGSELEGADVREKLLDRESFLGREKIEGFVMKNYGVAIDYHGQLYPLCQAKVVSDRFKERHKENPEYASPMEKIGWMVRTDARWEKAVNALRDGASLSETVKDIGPLLKKLHQDIDEEDVDFFKEELWKLFSRDIKKMACRGFPEWYKKRLADSVTA